MDPQSEDWHWTNEREPFLNVRWPVFKRDPQGECHAYHQCTYSVSDCPLTSRKRARDDPPNGGCRSENRKEEWEANRHNSLFETASTGDVLKVNGRNRPAIPAIPTTVSNR